LQVPVEMASNKSSAHPAPQSLSDKLRVIFLGPPNAGKGTQAEFLKKDYKRICHLATGDMLRAIDANTPLGKKVRQIMDAGALVPDDIIIDMLQDAITKPDCKDGFILDGFPRTLEQAKKLDSMLEAEKARLDRVFEFAIEDDIVVKRSVGRRVHPASGRTYNVDSKPPKVPEKDDVTGEPLIRRSDDNEETMRKRLTAYHQYTAPVVDFYRSKGLLTTVDASGPSTSVSSVIRKAIERGKAANQSH